MSSPKIAVAGHLGKDRLYKLRTSLEEIFGPSCPIEESIKFSEVRKRFGVSPDELMRELAEKSALIRWSYGGRAGNVSYQIALLGGRPVLITEAGRDFDEEYPGFWDGSYMNHLKRSGVSLLITVIESEYELEDVEQSSAGIILAKDKELAEIVCVTDAKHRNLFFINDLTAATVLAERRRVPTKILEQVDALFVTSGSHKFNLALMKAAERLGKTIYWDVGFFDLNGEYVLGSISMADTVFCNPVELERICELSKKSVSELSELCRLVIHDKVRGTAKVVENGQERRFGPIPIERRVSSIGCCDGFSAGFTLFDMERRSLEECILAALILSANVYAHEDVQTGMLRRLEVMDRLKGILESCAFK